MHRNLAWRSWFEYDVMVVGADREYRYFEDKQVVVTCNPPRRGGADRHSQYFVLKPEPPPPGTVDYR